MSAQTDQNVQAVDLAQLPIPQLNQLRSQFEEEENMLTQSLAQLKGVQSRFVESQECVAKMSKKDLGKPILVPLTSSMYVPGELANTETVLVDIGTGYHVKMNISDAKGYFDRIIEYITKKMEVVQKNLVEKDKLRQVTTDILQLKLQAQVQQQQQQTS